jgi:uncharacterized membrane protein
VVWQTALACLAVFALALASGLARQLRGGHVRPLERVVTLVVCAGFGFGLLSVYALFHGRSAGWPLLGLAAGYVVVLAGVLALRGRHRALEVLLGTLASACLSLAAIALLGGGTRATALSLQAIALLVLCRRLPERRLQWSALAALAVAATLVLLRTAPPDVLIAVDRFPLLDAGRFPTRLLLESLASVLSLAGGLAVAAWAVRASALPHLRRVLLWLSVAAAAYAIAIAIVEVGLRIDLSQSAFEASHTVVSVIWALAGAALVWLGLDRRSQALRALGMTLLSAALAKLFLFDLANLDAVARAASFIVVGLAALGVAIAYQRLSVAARAPQT